MVVDIERLDADWGGPGLAVFFSDENGAVFISNRSELLALTPVPNASDVVRPGPQAITSRCTHVVWILDLGAIFATKSIASDVIFARDRHNC